MSTGQDAFVPASAAQTPPLQPQPHPQGWSLPLRVKFTLWMVTIFVVIQFTVWAVVLIYQHQHFTGWINGRLQGFADKIGDAIRAQDFKVTDADLPAVISDPVFASVTEPFYIVLYDKDEKVVASTVRPAPTAQQTHADLLKTDPGRRVFRADVPGMRHGSEDEPGARLSVQRLLSPDGAEYMLVVGRPDMFYENTMREARGVLAVVIPVGIAAAGLAAWLISGLSLAPIHHLRRMATALSPEAIDDEIETPAILTGELAALEESLRQTREKLRVALHAQDRFISNVSHELKTPIAVVLTESQTLQLDTLPPEARRYAQSVSEEMRRLGRMVESFLTLTKIRDGRTLEHPTRCDANDFVMEAVSECGKMAAQYSVSIRAALDESDPPVQVMGEPELLRVMVDNIVRNAVRFSPPQTQVTVTVSQRGENCVISVRDHGPGIPPNMIEHIFDRFVQAGDEAMRLRGHGLGLSIAQGIAELHAGTISVRNVPEGGCEFSIVLLVARPITPVSPEIPALDASRSA